MTPVADEKALKLLRQMDGYLSSHEANSIWPGSKFHQDIKFILSRPASAVAEAAGEKGCTCGMANASAGLHADWCDCAIKVTPAASPAEGCATCQGFRVINKGWQQEPCPDCAPSPVAGMSEAERSAITEALACADYYLVEASKRQATDHRAREMKQYATTLRQLSARLSGQGVGK
jgi:hypothetical protein